MFSILLSLLTGCYNTTFMEGEYDRLVSIKMIADNKSSCKDPAIIKRFSALIEHQNEYAKYRTRRDFSGRSSNEIKESAKLLTHGNYTPEFCESKMKNISALVEEILVQLGKM